MLMDAAEKFVHSIMVAALVAAAKVIYQRSLNLNSSHMISAPFQESVGVTAHFVAAALKVESIDLKPESFPVLTDFLKLVTAESASLHVVPAQHSFYHELQNNHYFAPGQSVSLQTDKSPGSRQIPLSVSGVK